MIEGYKEKLLEMLIYFDNICEKNNLRYYAAGGTFLGAVRHHGFIPWDNDVDVSMPRSDYDRVAEIINSDNSKYTVETPQSKAPDFLYPMSKMYDTTTTVIEDLKVKCKRGVYIDIFPMDGIGDTFAEVEKNYRKLRLLNNFFATRTSIPRPQRKWWKNLAIRMSDAIIPECFINTKKLAIKLDTLCRKFDFDNSYYVGILLTQYGLRYIMPRTLFDEVHKYEFENITVTGVADYNQYLSTVYGNWRELPPIEKRTEGHDYKDVDLQHSYIEIDSNIQKLR